MVENKQEPFWFWTTQTAPEAEWEQHPDSMFINRLTISFTPSMFLNCIVHVVLSTPQVSTKQEKQSGYAKTNKWYEFWEQQMDNESTEMYTLSATCI